MKKWYYQAEDCIQNTIWKEIGARIAKYLFFWGMAAILAFSSYMDLQKMMNSRTETAGSQNADHVSDPKTEIKKRIALTFDDGPHPVYTKKLLEGLAVRQVTATFFVIGKNIPGNEDLIWKMKEEGHLIGNHTYDHVKICDLTGTQACKQVEKTSNLVQEITGEYTEFVRPPFGEWNTSMECSFTMIPVMWDVDPLDWTTQNTAEVVQKVIDSVQENDIILLHDCYDSSVEAALQIVDQLRLKGFEFVTVEELILE